MYTHNLTVKDPPNVTLSLKTSLGSTTIINGGYSPYNLFIADAVGVWFDPSDLTTMFQDSLGTTPVTAPGQPVGLILDKSKGLQIGPELVTNGDFATDTAWTKDSGWTISGGSANKVSGAATALYQPISVSVGKTYRLSFSATRSAGFFTPAFTNLGATVLPGQTVVTSGSYVQYLQPTSGVTHIIFYADSAFVGSIDNVSVKEVQGNHASQSTSSSRPIYQVVNGKACLDFDGVDDFLVTPSITPNADKVQVYTGVRKLSDSADGAVISFGNPSGTSGSIELNAPGSTTSSKYQFTARGTSPTTSFTTSSLYNSPVTNVVTSFSDISGDTNVLRINASQVSQITSDLGAGSFTSNPLYIGRKLGSTLPFRGLLFSLLVRFGANLSTNLTGSTESWVNQKTGAY